MIQEDLFREKLNNELKDASEEVMKQELMNKIIENRNLNIKYEKVFL